MLQRCVLGWSMIAVLVVATAPSAQAAPDPGTRCRTIKIAATGAHAQETLRCHTRAIGRGKDVVPACLATADAKLARIFERAERKTSCPPTLAAAKGESDAFVAALLAQAAPTPVPTPSPTPTPSPQFTGCGNGVVEAGETCDGQAFCTAACGFRLPTVCCGQSGFCLDGEFPVLADQCFLQGIPYVLGALCQLADPSCTNEPCAGTCQPELTFPPVSLCCESPSGCVDEQVSDSVALYQFFFQGCQAIGGGSAGVGTCGVGGDCVP